MNILLVQARPRDAMWLGGLTAMEPLSLEAIAAPLEREHKFELVDYFQMQDLINTVSSFKPDLCAITCSFTMDVNTALRVADAVAGTSRRPFMCVGGHHASLNPEDFLRDSVDCIVIGEGEVTFPELVRCLEHKRDLKTIPGLMLNQDGEHFLTGRRSPVKNLDDFPIPLRYLSKRFRGQYFCHFERPIGMVETTRGCPYRCNFCSVQKFYEGRVRFKSPERVVEEVAQAPEKAIFFTDDNFFISPDRSYQIGAQILQRKIKKRYYVQARSENIARNEELVRLWKEAGLAGVLMGFERADEAGLKAVNKQNTIENNEKARDMLFKHDVGMAPSFVVDPGETKEGFSRLREYVQRLDIKTPLFAVLTPLPGTDLYDEVKGDITVSNYDLFDCFHAVLPTRLPLEDFYQELSQLYTRTLKQYAHSNMDVGKALKKLRTGNLSPFHMRRLMKAVGMLCDPESYLSGHRRLEKDKLPTREEVPASSGV